MGQKPGSFCRMKNKRDKSRKHLIVWGHIVNLVWGCEDPELAWCLKMAEWIRCGLCQVEHLQGQESYLSFSLLMRHLGGSGSHLGPRKLFQPKSVVIISFEMCAEAVR